MSTQYLLLRQVGLIISTQYLQVGLVHQPARHSPLAGNRGGRTVSRYTMCKYTYYFTVFLVTVSAFLYTVNKLSYNLLSLECSFNLFLELEPTTCTGT